jgi:catechol 2,3-dioxygenase-like lactoylglutathione lyase family enzyme
MAGCWASLSKSASISRRHPMATSRPRGNKHVAFKIDDLEAFLVEMEGKGADIAFVVREAFGKGCFLRDITGNLIEFVEEAAV